MRRSPSILTLLAGCGLVLLTNLALLAAARWNRLDEPQGRLSLTERELALPWARQDEGTGLALSLVLSHRAPGSIRRTARWKSYDLPAVDYEWLDRSKLVELGFEAELDPTDPEAVRYYANVLPRSVYVVVEYDGDAWRSWIVEREAEVEKLRREVADGIAEPGELADAEAVLLVDRTMRSRLFPVDAGTDPAALLRRYGDRPGHAVLAAVLRPEIARSKSGTPILTAAVLEPVVGRLNVPRALRSPLDVLLPRESGEEVEARERKEAARGWPAVRPPRYRCTVAIGRRLEPWLTEVTPLPLTSTTPAGQTR